MERGCAGVSNHPSDAMCLTPGIATYATLANLAANGYTTYCDPRRMAVSLFNPAADR
jgi:hypothetical protein